ncbi:MAG: uracil phosphoribosyltransferase, partial [Spirochaetales bacterium]|nr:uracil phosphoribosyltransferase [Spirochaetales bacterium]
MNKIVLKAEDLDGYLTENDRNNIRQLDDFFAEATGSFEILSSSHNEERLKKEKNRLIGLYDSMGRLMQNIASKEEHLHIYPFDTPVENHGEASRLIAKLRNKKTQHQEFVYYIQRAYELLFNLAYGEKSKSGKKNYLVIDTPVIYPVQNYAIHKIPDVDHLVENTVMCVMLRGALLPSMIMSKEIEEYSSSNFVTPFALFKIKRDDSKREYNMEYVLDLDKSFYNLEELNGKDLIFADPMSA